jgi:hypothetical protein
MARRKKKLRPSELSRQGALELPNREAMSLIEPGLGIVDLGMAQQPGQPGLEGTNPTDDTGGTPTDAGGTTDPTGSSGTTTGLEGKATRIVGPLPSIGA